MDLESIPWKVNMLMVLSEAAIVSKPPNPQVQTAMRTQPLSDVIKSPALIKCVGIQCVFSAAHI